MTGDAPVDDAPEHDAERGDASARARRARSPGIGAAFDELKDTGRATFAAGTDALKAFRILFAADVSLARSALGRMLALTGVAIAFGASCWLLLMAAAVTWLYGSFGLSLTAALLICALVSALVTGWAIWLADRYFEHTRLKATRRQLARLGIGELAEFMPGPGDPRSTREAAQAMKDRTDAPPKKGLGVDVTPP